MLELITGLTFPPIDEVELFPLSFLVGFEILVEVDFEEGSDLTIFFWPELAGSAVSFEGMI